MDETVKWNGILASIIEATRTTGEGYYFIEIKEIPHLVWEQLPGTLHEFKDQSPRYVKEDKPILNLTVKYGCRCREHKQSNPKEVIPEDRILSDEERENFKDWFVKRGFEYP